MTSVGSLRGFVCCVIAAAAAAAPPTPVVARIAQGAPAYDLPLDALGATLDWWPNWGSSSLLSLDVAHPRLRSLARSLGAITLRLGGSLDAIVQYWPNQSPAQCARPQVFRGATYSLCLNASRWAELFSFARDALAPGSHLVFGLQLDLGAGGAGPWRGENALAFLAAAAASDPSAAVLSAFEVGEEVNPAPGSPGFAALLSAYAGVRAAIARLWPSPRSRPLTLGPCVGMPYNIPPFSWTSAWVAAALGNGSAPPLVDAFVMHSYNNDGGANWTRPGFLAQTGAQAAGLRDLLDAAGHAATPLWCGECGPHNDNGLGGITTSARSSFWFLDALLGLPIFCRNHFFLHLHDLLL